MKKRLKKIFMTLLIIIGLLIAATALFLQLPMFGKQPSGARLERIKQSPNYKDGKFQNLNHTPDLAEGVSYYRVMSDFFFKKSPRQKPKLALPSQKTDLLHLDPKENVVVWFGHSSYFIQTDGKKILVDPLFSGAASPIAATTRAFPGSDVYSVDDFPEIDYLFISHDHWDHLDYDTVKKLKPKVKKIITGLGTGEHFEYWGFDLDKIVEKDWYEGAYLGDGFSVTITPGRHFAGRGLTRNSAQWVSFVFQTPTVRLFLGGDSGYDTHFKAIGDKYGPFDLAFLECGQYNEYWKYIHMMPEQVVTAAEELKTKRLMPVHWAKFSLALHAWDEPIIRVTAAAQKVGMPLVTPMIGQKVSLTDTAATFPHWWVGLE